MFKKYFKQITFLFFFILLVTVLFACQITASAQITNVTITIKANVKAQVYIGNIYKGDTPLTLKIGIGKYPLKLMANGYQTFETVITVSTTGPKEFSFTLQPVGTTNTTTTTTTTTSNSKARLIVKADIPCYIYSNNIRIGMTPLDVQMYPGTYEIKAEPTDKSYAPKTEKINLSKGQVLELNFKFIQPQPQLYSVTINSNIPAQVLINNNPAGNTPLTINLAAGTYTITLNPLQGGYSSLTQTITVSAPNQVFNFTLNPQLYSVTINSNVPAQVLINNNPVGNTSLTINLAAGTYTITLNPLQGGYSSLTQTIVVSQPNQVFNFTLNAITGNIIFNLPNDAKVFINGQPVQFKANSQMAFPAGTYTIRIEYHGLVVEKTITITANQTITISIGLNIIVS
jgi:hypothetical protein